MAEIDPEEILRQLPPPEVNYTLPEIKAVKPPIALPDEMKVEYYGRTKPSTRPLEKALKQIESVKDNPVVSSTVKLIKRLADARKEEQNTARNTAKGVTAQPGGQPAQTTSAAQKSAAVDSSTPTRPVKPPPVTVVAAPSHPPPTGNLMAAWQTLRKNPGVVGFEESLARDKQLAEDAFEMALQLSEKESTKSGEDGDSGEDSEVAEGEEGESAPAGSHDAVLATAMGLYKKQDWKGIKDLFSENPEAGATKDGLRYMIEAEINEAKPNYMQIRRYSDQLAKIDENDAMANYGLALAYYNAKKPNTAKAGEHLAIALKAKDPPEGASAFYWSMTFKKFMIPLLLVIAGLIGGIAQIIKKKKKAAAGIDLEKPAEPAGSEQELKPQGKLMQKLAPLLDKFKGILARFKKKPANAPSEEESASASENAADSDQSEDSDEAETEEETEETEETEEEEENELEAEDEEAAEDDEEEETEEEEEKSS